MPDDDSIRLLERVRAQDAAAAEELFHRYLHRLIALAGSRLNGQLARRVDADDIVQSAYRSFFRGAQQGKFVLQRSGDLWRLLAAITLNKLAKQRERHGAAQRDVSTELSVHNIMGSLSGVCPDALATDPTPEQAAAIIDEVEFVMRGLDPTQRQILMMRLDGHQLTEIAAEVSRSERTVRRTLDRIKDQLQERLNVG